jgi:MscS family membrane protein
MDIAGAGIVQNSAGRWIAFLGVVLVSLAGGRLGRFFLERLALPSRLKKEWMKIALGAVARTSVLVCATAGFWFVVTWRILLASDGVYALLDAASKVLTSVAIGILIYRLVDIVDGYLHALAARSESKVDDILAPMVGRSIRVLVATLVILNVATVVSGKSMTTILAGVGVGGLAVALAAQDTIKNFFGSLVILGDKPFEIGDRITVDGHDGPVEGVGFRSTRIRTLEGHVVTIPNSELANKTIRNIGRRKHIRRLMNLTITYDTPPEKVRRAVEIVKEILDNHEGMDPEFPPRVCFSEFNDCSLNILALYWYHPPDYWQYMDFSERVNMQILERFNAEGIEFAFPSRTVYVANDDNRQMALRLLGDDEPGGEAGG